MSTGILTKGQRAFLRGEKDVADPEGYRGNIRYRTRKRMDRIEQDLVLLREAGEDDLVEEFYNRFDRVGRLEDELEQLREEQEGE